MTRIQLADLNSAVCLDKLDKFQQKQVRGGRGPVPFQSSLPKLLNGYQNGLYSLEIVPTYDDLSGVTGNALKFTPVQNGIFKTLGETFLYPIS